MDAIVDRLQFCRLINNKLRRCYFTAVVKPAGDMQGFPLLVCDAEMGKFIIL
jgi:hypothetical protein